MSAAIPPDIEALQRSSSQAYATTRFMGYRLPSAWIESSRLERHPAALRLITLTLNPTNVRPTLTTTEMTIGVTEFDLEVIEEVEGNDLNDAAFAEHLARTIETSSAVKFNRLEDMASQMLIARQDALYTNAAEAIAC